MFVVAVACRFIGGERMPRKFSETRKYRRYLYLQDRESNHRCWRLALLEEAVITARCCV